MNLRNVSTRKEEAKKLLEDKIKKLKEELELYEYLLALLESGYTRKEGGEVTEIEYNRKTIGIIKKKQDALELSLLFNAVQNPQVISFLKKQVELLTPDAQVEIEGGEKVRRITIEKLRAGASVMAGLAEALRIVAVELYQASTRP